MNLKSNYLQRAENEMPKAGSERPWWNKAVWFNDFYTLWAEKFDNSIVFSKATKKVSV
jgi:hypothetical protein